MILGEDFGCFVYHNETWNLSPGDDHLNCWNRVSLSIYFILYLLETVSSDNNVSRTLMQFLIVFPNVVHCRDTMQSFYDISSHQSSVYPSKRQ